MSAYVETESHGFYIEVDVHDPRLLAEVTEGKTTKEQIEELLLGALDPGYCGASVEFVDYEESDGADGGET